MLLIFEVVDATAMPFCHVGNFQDRAGRLRWRVAVKRKLFAPLERLLKTIESAALIRCWCCTCLRCLAALVTYAVLRRPRAQVLEMGTNGV